MKGNKGITLIALVITIIVLLILAGVSIAMLSGDNSILTKAQEARDKSSAGTLDETVKIAVGNIITANLGWPVDDSTTSGTDEGVTVTGTATSPNRDLKAEVEKVNPALAETGVNLTFTPGGSTPKYWTVTAQINGQTQTVYVTQGTGAVTATAPAQS